MRQILPGKHTYKTVYCGMSGISTAQVRPEKRMCQASLYFINLKKGKRETG
jgi:hypothetical protein